MVALASVIFNRLRNLTGPPSDAAPPAASSTNDTTQIRRGRTLNDAAYHPSPIDITVVRIMLARSKKLPPDVVDFIFDQAEYWASTTASVSSGQVIGTSSAENTFLLRTLPIGLTSAHGGNLRQYEKPASRKRLNKARDPQSFAHIAEYPTPRLEHPVRKIVFRIAARENPLGGNPTYKDSWSWFDAGLERFEDASDSQNSSLQHSLLRPVQPPLNTHIGYHTDWQASDSSDASDDESQSETEPKPERLVYQHDLLPEPNWLVHRVEKGHKEFQDYRVVWSWTDDVQADSKEGQELEKEGRGRATGSGEFVRSLKMGDVLTLWAKARFQGWSNNYDAASVTVYWAV